MTASIISTTSGARLVLAGTATGADNAITVTETDGGSGLSSLVYDPADSVTNLTQTQAAQDANYSINGFAATSPSNVVSGAISGVTLNLLKASAADTPTTLTISPDTTAAQTSISTFVTALNGVLSSIQSLTGYNSTTQTAGALYGQRDSGGLPEPIGEHSRSSSISGNASSGVSSLADLGITADADGNYDTNSTTLGNALSANLTAVGNLLGGTNGIATQINSLINSYTGTGRPARHHQSGTAVEPDQCVAAANRTDRRIGHVLGHLDRPVQRHGHGGGGAERDSDLSHGRIRSDASAASGTSSTNSSLGSGSLGT